MKKKKKSVQITKLILLISFLILFGRLIYSFMAALEHHQQTQQQSVELLSSPKTE
ncbi:YfgG family protein [Xenorhabdus sp. Sc-CR9]|uniref:YfgG family protein n=1 Tax=Xenorhabdus sp. Sc-CR9 TaxID=2584468 RepID=UPI001F32A03C|nr:YfgG family protein [Xenorhabdus sp. Sc-CR9]